MGEAKRRRAQADPGPPTERYREFTVVLPESTWELLEAEAWQLGVIRAAEGAVNSAGDISPRDILPGLIRWALEVQSQIREGEKAEAAKSVEGDQQVQIAQEIPSNAAAIVAANAKIRRGRDPWGGA